MLESSLKAFFSVDIVGSTEFKARAQSEAGFANWVKIFENFFKDFPTIFQNAIRKRLPDNVGHGSYTPQVWKILGDEVLFYWRVDEFENLRIICMAFYEAMCNYDEQLKKKSGLRVKGSAWLAGFPIRNSEIYLEDRKDKPDFIGPDIDSGFRLSAFARPRRLIVSMDLADVLATVSPVENFNFHHVGWAALKGVHLGTPYPLIWVRDDDPPRMATPWEDVECGYTRSFLSAESVRDQKSIMRLVEEIRESLPALHLFRPYCEKKNMPDFHKKIAQDREETERKDDLSQSIGLEESFEQTADDQDSGIDQARSGT